MPGIFNLEVLGNSVDRIRFMPNLILYEVTGRFSKEQIETRRYWLSGGFSEAMKLAEGDDLITESAREVGLGFGIEMLQPFSELNDSQSMGWIKWQKK